MSSAALDEVLQHIRGHVDRADLNQQLLWLDEIACTLLLAGSRYRAHNAYHAGATDELRLEMARLMPSPVSDFLHRKLAKNLIALCDSPSPRAAESMVINSSFVLSTLVDMLQNPEQPFEVTALLYEGQAMFDDWYDQLLAMIGLTSNA